MEKAVNINIPSGSINVLSRQFTMADITLAVNAELDWNIDPSTGAIYFPSYDGMVQYFIDIRLTGNINLGSGNLQEASIELFRQVQQNVAVSKAVPSTGSMDNKGTLIATYTATPDDPYTTGVQVRFNNTTNGSTQITGIVVVIMGQKF